ncbi:MAG: diaminopimelate decarboxylase [Chloroflexi bacterium]|nr:diaminopimelate decarboxylase [Chloroflexota bacterium]
MTDVDELVRSAEAVRAAFPDPWIRSFSVKANDVSAIVGRVTGLGFGANVVSRGEWTVARRAGFPNKFITFEGIGKTDEDLRAALRASRDGAPLRWLAIESLDEARSLVRLATRGPAHGTLDLLFRHNPGVLPDTHAGLAVGTATSKFGMTADEVTAAIALVVDAPGLRPRGIHLHVGSQLRSIDAWRDGIRRSLALGALMRGTWPDFDTLDVGGGFPVLPEDEPAPDPARFAREVPDLLAQVPDDRRPTRLAIEPGRVLVARAGYLVGRVLHVRERQGRQVILDVGMSDLIRPALYGARHEIIGLTSLGRPWDRSAASQGPVAPARVEGPICESTDHLGEHRLPDLHRGDLVAIRDTGAYAASLSSTYNGRPRVPQVLLEDNGRLVLARRRGSVNRLG